MNIHVDDFIGSSDTDPYASFVLNYFRMPAMLMMKLRPFMAAHKLFCDFEGRRWRVTGASRLGDVWLAADHERDVGYDRRVDVDACTGWGSA